MPSMDSSRFLIQMAMNIFLCTYAKRKLQKMNNKKQGKNSLKSYLVFILFSITLILLNQGLFFFFKPPNLYQQLQISRSMSPQKILAYQDDLKIKIMQIETMPLNQKMQAIKKVQSMVQVLTHPARRLSYDTFSQTDTGYAWCFKNHYYLLSSIITASAFYIVCTLINMINEKRGEIKQVFKLEIMAMILLFLWEVEIVLKTEDRIHSYTDSLDSFYTAFPIFERRQMMKIILIPSMNIIKFFYRYYVQSSTEKKFKKIGKNSYLREITNKVADKAAKIQFGEQLQQKMNVFFSQVKKNDETTLTGNIYALQRQTLKCIIAAQGENMLQDQEIRNICSYYRIQTKNQSIKKQLKQQ